MESKSKMPSFDVVLPLILAVFMAAIIATCVLQFNENKAKHRAFTGNDTMSNAEIRMFHEMDSLFSVGPKNMRYIISLDTIYVLKYNNKMWIYKRQK